MFLSQQQTTIDVYDYEVLSNNMTHPSHPGKYSGFAM
jgi:hypothetical protein